MELIERYFGDLTDHQKHQFKLLDPIYREWNSKINVISRKDIDELYLHHVLHSLAIARIHSFNSGAKVLDVGTGGGFPGIPLAILFPEVHFTLVDSIGKKIKVVEEVSAALGLNNVIPLKSRAEMVSGKFDYVVSRAVTNLKDFIPWVHQKIMPGNSGTLKNGILYLKGGDLSFELEGLKAQHTIYNLVEYFKEPFFETKLLIHLVL